MKGEKRTLSGMGFGQQPLDIGFARAVERSSERESKIFSSSWAKELARIGALCNEPTFRMSEKILLSSEEVLSASP